MFAKILFQQKNTITFVFGMFAQVLLQQKMTAIPANLKSEMGMGEDEDLAKWAE